MNEALFPRGEECGEATVRFRVNSRLPLALGLPTEGEGMGAGGSRASLSPGAAVAVPWLLAGRWWPLVLPPLIASSFVLRFRALSSRLGAQLPLGPRHPPATPARAGGGGSLAQLQGDNGRNPEEQALGLNGRSHTGPGAPGGRE